MWDLTNRTPFAARGGFDRDAEARSFWIVWIKASFRMRRAGPCRFMTPQLPLFQALVPDGDGGWRGGCDVALPRPSPELVLSGTVAAPHAGSGRDRAAPHDTPARPVSVTLGAWSKRLWLRTLPSDVGARHDRGTSPSAAARRVRIDGPSALATPEAAVEDRPRWVLADDPQARVSRDGAELRGFGPIPPQAPERQRWAGTYDEAWRTTRMPVLPSDFDPRFLQEAPEDQWLPAAPPRATVLRLENMVDGVDDYRCELPHLDLEVATRFKGRWSASRAALQIVRVDLDAGTLSLSFASALPILAAANDVRVERSEIVLRDRAGFVVAPEDLAAYEAALQAV